jgi:hypothetical protein
MSSGARGRAVAVAALLAAGLGVSLSLRASQEPRRWFALDGRDWTQFSPKEKQAYMAGFLAGSANAAGAARLGATATDADTAIIRRTVDSLYHAGGLKFPFGHMVYASQLDEFYWWDNHVPVPLYLALWSINQRLRQPEHDP